MLKENPEFDALALAYDESATEPFVVRKSYEHTHAANNFYAARRYPNLIDDGATQCFVEKTHDAYYSRLAEHFGKTIRAFFTDEPSLAAVNIGQLPQEVRKSVRVVDRQDENIKPLPSVPWAGDLAAKYKARYGEDIMAVRKSLFAGESQADKRVRRQYWALVTDLLAERYFGKIQRWAQKHGVVSSGHILWEEQPLHGAPLSGNPLKMLSCMDIPGLDMLNSDPEAVIYTGWLTAGLPASAAIFNGGRRVMTEVSDFSQVMAKQGPVSLDKMRATAAWQAAFGVTEFTLYYNRAARSAEDWRAYCDFVGRLNAVLREARPAPQVLLYYPIYDVWGEYRPVGEPLALGSQSQQMQKVVNSFMQLGQMMVRRQVLFALADHEMLAAAKVRDGRISIGRHSFDMLVLPDGVELPKDASGQVVRFEQGGGKKLSSDLQGLGGSLSVANDRIVIGRFVRDGREIL
ncbi:MAG: hypothetical protein ABIH03_12215, partial [Pseudomonadota bacterium]